ncbi:thiamine phosphate synthase [Hydrogenimonas thermophila]|uniref:thiamine phosphate synthase n=1 Tax=Hydrogenimonas thermophila TaxID=223786 RepID=UPI00293727E5|nr:thiamine phosphate synthase [Hydrogenimonas thermophila]WOE70903.1 thiamine phosphate synthase [Hydrogenimonas thermophila]WOE73421.1 thiamine phosphate synthase [Hydrogenimonas thermophila]
MKIYALLDEASLQKFGWNTKQFVERAKNVGAQIIQYRNKNGSLKEIKSRLEEIVSLFDGIVIVNDYPELAHLCHGLHVGQEDLKNFGATPHEAVLTLKKKIGDSCWLGISTHNAEEIEIANTLPLNYIGLGAYRNTNTKSDARVLGDELPRLAALSHHPVAAIGGVTLSDKIDNVTYLVIGSALYR